MAWQLRESQSVASEGYTECWKMGRDFIVQHLLQSNGVVKAAGQMMICSKK